MKKKDFYAMRQALIEMRHKGRVPVEFLAEAWRQHNGSTDNHDSGWVEALQEVVNAWPGEVTVETYQRNRYRGSGINFRIEVVGDLDWDDE